MVQNKHFKALVRERMAKTGERYTAARLHILASRPDLPGLESPASQDDAALWRRVFAQSGIVNPATSSPFTTATLAGLAGGIGFMVATFAYQEITTATVVLRAHPEPYTERLLERSRVSVDRTLTTSPRVAERALDAALDEGRVSVVRVTHGALPWISSASLEYQDSIDVAVVGRDGDVFLIDGEQRVTRAELAAARSARKADKHWAVSVAPSPTDAARLAASVRAAIIETTGRLLGTLPLDGIPPSWLPKFGVQGMRTWAGLLRDGRTKQGWPAMFSDEQRLRTGLEMVQSTAGGSRWGGPGGLRGRYADFLTESAALAGMTDLARAAQSYRELAPLWDEFIDAIDPEIAMDGRDHQFALMAERLEALASKEEQAARDLRDIVSRTPAR